MLGPLSKIKIEQIYRDYTPPFDVEPMVRHLLKEVPDSYLNGLARIVITNTKARSRSNRRGKARNDKRVGAQANARGLYYEAWKGEPAYIV